MKPPGAAVAWLLVACVLLIPATVSAQATLSGTVRDTSGAVLPGVAVEASSPALIERARTAITDNSGQYRIIDLRPGVYQLTFQLRGFTTVERTGVAISGVAVTTIDAQLAVGAEVTVRVSGETPTIDTQSTVRQAVLDYEVINALPVARGYGALLTAVPALQGGYLNSQVMPVVTFFNTYGGRPNEGRVQLDGLNVGSAFNGAGVSPFAFDTMNAAEVQVTLSGGLGESDVGSAHINIIPRAGGNTFAGNAFFSTAGEWSRGSNVADDLRPAEIIKAWDLSGALGGPIRRERLWFFGAVRNFGQHTDVPNRYANANAGTTSWFYAEDPSVKVRSATREQVQSIRLTAQASSVDKLGFYLDQQYVCVGSSLTAGGGGCRERGSDWVALGGAFAAPESATAYLDNGSQRIVQATWTRPHSTGVLLDAGYSTYISHWGGTAPPGGITNLTPVTELSARQCTPAAPCPDGRTSGRVAPFPIFTYRGLDNITRNMQNPHNWRGSVSYVTGSHNMKFGYQGNHYIEETHDGANDTQVSYTFFDGTPVGVTARIAPWQTSNRTTAHGFYAQDQWTLGMLTLQGALRYDRAWSWFPAAHNGAPEASRFNAAPITFGRGTGVTGYNDLTTRVGAAWDVFGNGRTALKVNLGKYLQAATNQTPYTITNPALDGRNGRGGPRFQTLSARAWEDSNGNFLPDCDLLNPAFQNLTGSGGDICGQGDPTFGSSITLLDVNPDILHGWGVRPYDWHFGLLVQQEVLPRVSLEVGYNRRSFGNFFVTDNRNRNPSDYDAWTLTAPSHPDLPGGGGYEITVYDLKPAAFALPPSLYYTFESDFGPERTHYWHGIDAHLIARTRNGLTIRGGTSTGRGVMDRCDTLPLIDSPEPRNCHITERWITNFRGLAMYTLPGIDVLVAGIVRFQTTATGVLASAESHPGSNGVSLNAVYQVPNSIPQAQLQRLPAGETSSTGTTSVNLVNAGEVYPTPIRQVDMRFAKVFRFGGARTHAGIDVYNLLNSRAATGVNENFGTDGATWLEPTSVLNPRLIRFHVTLDF